MSATHTRPIYARRAARESTLALRHVLLGACAALLLAVALVLAVIVKRHPGPLPGDLAIELHLQHALRPYPPLTSLLDTVSNLNWPLPSALCVIALLALLLLLRRWLGAIVAGCTAAVAGGSNYLTAEIVQRPRPSDHGLHISAMVQHYYSFPSGHVLFVWAFYGFLLYLTFRPRRTAAWLWVARLVLLAMVVLIEPSRIWEGEHWPSDVLEGLLYGAFWLIVAMQVYHWAWHRWPHMRGWDQPQA